MKKDNPLKKWDKEALDYIVKLKSKAKKINLSIFVRSSKVVKNENNIIRGLKDIKSILAQIDDEIKLIYENLTKNNRITSIKEITTDMKAKDAIILAIKLYKTDLMGCCKLSYYKDGKVYRKYMRKDKNGVVYRNINRLYELRELRGKYLLEFIYSVYRDLPRILRFERGE